MGFARTISRVMVAYMLPWWLAAVGIPVGAAVLFLAMRIAGRRQPDPGGGAPTPEPGGRAAEPETGER